MGNIPSSYNDKYFNIVLNLAIEFESIYCKREANACIHYSVYQNALTQFILDRLSQFKYDKSLIISFINDYKPHNIEWMLDDQMKGICLEKNPDKIYNDKKIDVCKGDTLDKHYNKILSLI